MKLLLIALSSILFILLGQDIPQLPDIPNLPNIPSLPSLPKLPGLPNESFSQGERETENYQFNTDEIEFLDISMDVSIGELKIESNRQPNEIDGRIQYNPDRISPDVVYRTIGSKGKLKIKIDSKKGWNDDDNFSFDFNNWKGLNRGKELGYEAKFKFPEDIPIELNLDFGLGEANIDFSKLTISDLNIECGLSDVDIEMKTPNPIPCKRVSIETGLGNFEAKKLGNLRPRYLNLQVGLGSADIDLTGAIDDDLEGEIDVGLGTLELTLPKHTNIKLEIDHGFLSSVDVDGLVKTNEVWLSPHWYEDIPTIELKINVSLGTVEVDIER